MPNIGRSVVHLRIIGDNLDPDEITRTLCCQPTAAHRRGDLIRISAGAPLRSAKQGRWDVTIESRPKSDGDLEPIIRELLGRVTDDTVVWQSLAARYEIHVFCGLFMEDCNESFGLSADLCEMLAARRIHIGFDIYGPWLQ
jgi:Domain of unknown function (DUF4279)